MNRRGMTVRMISVALVAATGFAPLVGLLGSNAVVVAGAPCTYNASDGTVTVSVPRTGSVTIERDADGRILVDSQQCALTATVFNTDLIRVVATGDAQHVKIKLEHGGFMPGLTDEQFAHDEIEFELESAGIGSTEYFELTEIVGGAASDGIHVREDEPVGSGAKINLNDHMDDDFDLIVQEQIFANNLIVRGGRGDDAILIDSFISHPVTVYGDAGADVIVGSDAADVLVGGDGADVLNGGAGGADQLFGDAGRDHLDGGLGRASDELRGHAGADVLVTADSDGNDIANGGSSSDRCYTDPNDTRISC